MQFYIALSNFSSHLCYTFFFFPAFFCVRLFFPFFYFALTTTAIRSNMKKGGSDPHTYGKDEEKLFYIQKREGKKKKKIPWPSEARNFSSSFFHFYCCLFIPQRKQKENFFFSKSSCCRNCSEKLWTINYSLLKLHNYELLFPLFFPLCLKKFFFLSALMILNRITKANFILFVLFFLLFSFNNQYAAWNDTERESVISKIFNFNARVLSKKNVHGKRISFFLFFVLFRENWWKVLLRFWINLLSSSFAIFFFPSSFLLWRVLSFRIDEFDLINFDQSSEGEILFKAINDKQHKGNWFVWDNKTVSSS